MNGAHGTTVLQIETKAILCYAGELEQARRYSESFLQLAEAEGGPVREQAGRLLVQVYIRLAELPVHRSGDIELLHTAYNTATRCRVFSVLHTRHYHTATHCRVLDAYHGATHCSILTA